MSGGRRRSALVPGRRGADGVRSAWVAAAAGCVRRLVVRVMARRLAG